MIESLQTLFGSRLKENELLAKHTNFRIGGPARWFVEVKSEDELKQAVRIARETATQLFVLGGGSNTLAKDEGYDGLVVKIGLRRFSISGRHVTADAGVISAALARATASAGLQGLEWAISLPGTIGGAVRGNAGCFGGEIKDVFNSARVLSDGKIVEVSKDDMQFGYRESSLKHSADILLSVVFGLKEGNADVLKKRLQEMLDARKASQPLYAGSAGCVFKNIEFQSSADLQRLSAEVDIPSEMIAHRRISAGWLVDQLGLKGKKIGQAQISPEHGNFILNLGTASASEVVQLIAFVKTRAHERFGIHLHEEVQYLGF